MTPQQLDQLIGILAPVTLIEMMISIGLGVAVADVVRVARDWRMLLKAAIASYICVPAAAVGLLILFHSDPMVAVGFLIIAVCPGAPYGPPLTAIAKGNTPVSVGLMVALAASSAFLTPQLLVLLIPMVLPYLPSASEETSNLAIDSGRMALTLFAVQFVPLGIGLAIRRWKPSLADRLKSPANRLCMILNLVLLGLILWAQEEMLAGVPLRGYFGMSLLVLASVVAGLVFSGPGYRSAMVMATAIRNVGVCLVIVTAAFPGTRAVAAVAAFALFQTILMSVVAVFWGRIAASRGPGP